MNSSADYARALIARAQDDRYVLERLAGDANAPSGNGVRVTFLHGADCRISGTTDPREAPAAVRELIYQPNTADELREVLARLTAAGRSQAALRRLIA